MDAKETKSLIATYITTRQRAVITQLAAESRRSNASIIRELLDLGLAARATTYRCVEVGDSAAPTLEYQTASAEQAARAYLLAGPYDAPTDATEYVTVAVTGPNGVVTRHTLAVDPACPPCTKPAGHAWREASAHSRGADVITTERCDWCRLSRTVTTGAVNPATGEGGLTSVRYVTSDEDE